MKQYTLKNSNNDSLILKATNDKQAMKEAIRVLCEIADCVFITKEIRDTDNVNIVTN